MNKHFSTIRLSIILTSALVSFSKASILETTVSKKIEPSVENKRLNPLAAISEMDPDQIEFQWEELVKNPQYSAMDLEQALIAAYDNNKTIMSARRETLAQHEKIVQAKAGFLPTINLSTSYNESIGKAQNSNNANNNPNSIVTSNSHDMAAEIKQNLFNGGATLSNINAADKSIRAYWANLVKTEQDTFINVISAYMDVVTKRSTVEVQKAYQTAMKQNYETSFEKHKIGEETITQVANAEAKLKDAEAKLIAAEAESVKAEALFLSITGVHAGNLKLPPKPKKISNDLNDILKQALQNNPSIITARYEYESSRANVDAATAQLLSPSVDVSASSSYSNGGSYYDYSRNSAGISRDGFRNRAKQVNNKVGVSVTYNLYNGGNYSSQRREAHERALSKRFAIENAKEKVVSDTKGIFEAYKAAKINIQNFKQQVKAAQIAVDATQQEVQVGSKVVKDTLDAQYNLLSAQIQYLQAKSDYYKTAYQLMALMGYLNAKDLKLKVNYFDPFKHFENTPVGY